MKNNWLLLILACASALLISCSEPIPETQPQPVGTAETEVKRSVEDVTNAEIYKDGGDFYIVYEESDNAYYQGIKEAFEEESIFEPITTNLNDAYNLPYDIPIVFVECGQANAVYNPEEQAIIVCYELMEEIGNTLAAQYTYETDEDRDTEIIYAISFILYHEIGHALVDAYDIPITGREEDAVDRLSTIILLSYDENLPVVITAANVLRLLEENNEELAFWDEHSLGQQRFYDILCLAYGKNPEAYAAAEENVLLEKDILPEERAERCSYEYEQALQSWETLLAPYNK